MNNLKKIALLSALIVTGACQAMKNEKALTKKTTSSKNWKQLVPGPGKVSVGGAALASLCMAHKLGYIKNAMTALTKEENAGYVLAGIMGLPSLFITIKFIQFVDGIGNSLSDGFGMRRNAPFIPKAISNFWNSKWSFQKEELKIPSEE